MELKEAIQSIKTIDDLKRVIEHYGTSLITKGNTIKANCPIHGEKTPSFYLKDNGSGAYYKCFGCGAGGDIVNFIQAKEGLTTLEATKKAYEILGLKCDLKPSKIDNLRNYIETNKFYKIDNYYIEDIKETNKIAEVLNFQLVTCILELQNIVFKYEENYNIKMTKNLALFMPLFHNKYNDKLFLLYQ